MNIHLNKKILTFVYCLALNYINGKTQVNLIYYDDTLEQSLFMEGFVDHISESCLIFPFFDFKENLPDGDYYYLSKERPKKGLIVNDTSTFLIKGKYKNNLRNGKFEYYGFCAYDQKKKRKRKLLLVFNYKDGLMDGFYSANDCSVKLIEGNFELGRRHGFFYFYDDSGQLIKVELYQNDVLIAQSKLGTTTQIETVE